MASHNFLILSDKSNSVLNLTCNRFAAELNEMSVSQVECGDPGLSKEDSAIRYGYSVSVVKPDCVNHKVGTRLQLPPAATERM